ncbi:phage baseplate protein [Vibrio plantisponsor]|uniref:Phage baseplate protein n=1 Tax=Vibrio plantisponsor TaxID=664643 RepID=A0ABU4IDZ3_9VIBR|nr:phage baseplate protein [Vibrio plantisponsor]MDW6016773.1 phage baseplate protein [Vibrio plantisponsor]NNM39856.1 phage baseplate protein [Vibrio plantisponsor]
MIAIDQDNGLTVTGISALKCRIKRVLTTQVTSRIKRRTFGNRAVDRLGNNQNPAEAMIIQNLSIDALTNEQNGLTGLTVSQCQAVATATGFAVAVVGSWQGEPLTTSVSL